MSYWEIKQTPNSSRIAEIAYFQETLNHNVELSTGILRITFKPKKNESSPQIYEYRDVPRMVWVKLYFAESTGREFEIAIKGNYKYTRIQ